MEDKLICRICGEEAEYLKRFFDRNGIYSGRACSEECGSLLPGQGEMWNYDPEEDIEPSEEYYEETWGDIIGDRIDMYRREY